MMQDLVQVRHVNNIDNLYNHLNELFLIYYHNLFTSLYLLSVLISMFIYGL